MKIKYLLATTCLTLAGFAYAGLIRPAPVVINMAAGVAFGDQYTARTAKDDTSYIGCGTRRFDDGMGNSQRFGFCRAGDSDGNEVNCLTFNPNLLDEMRALSAYGSIVFGWVDDGAGNLTCNSVGFSTLSHYLPNVTTKGKN